MKVELWQGPQDGALVEINNPLPPDLYVPLGVKLEEDAFTKEQPIQSEPRLRQGRYQLFGVRPGGRRVYKWMGEEAPL